MDYYKGRINNELSNFEYYVWTRLNPEIDPGKWALLCRKIGKMSSEEFNYLIALLNARNSLKNALKRHIKGILGIYGHSRN